jgi:homogentisate 1,2-dioxygenase
MVEQTKQDTDSNWNNLTYHAGFGNHFESEAEKGALIKGRNNP